MIIIREVYDYIINNVPDSKFECGGILGLNSEKIAVSIQLDMGLHFRGMKICNYYPDVTMLNQCILEWSKKDIVFGGIFHTHFSEIASFSEGDLEYIKKILLAMPKGIDTIYFPIFLLPVKKLIPFKVNLLDEILEVNEDTLEII